MTHGLNIHLVDDDDAMRYSLHALLEVDGTAFTHMRPLKLSLMSSQKTAPVASSLIWRCQSPLAWIL